MPAARENRYNQARAVAPTRPASTSIRSRLINVSSVVAVVIGCVADHTRQRGGGRAPDLPVRGVRSWPGGDQRPLRQDAAAGAKAAKVAHGDCCGDEAGRRDRSRDCADAEGDVGVETRIGCSGSKLLDPSDVGLAGWLIAIDERRQVSVGGFQSLQVIHQAPMQLSQRRRRGHPKRGRRARPSDLLAVRSSSGAVFSMMAPTAQVTCARWVVRTSCWARLRWGRWVSSNRKPPGGARSCAFSWAIDCRNARGSRIATSMARIVDTATAQAERFFKLTISRSFCSSVPTVIRSLSRSIGSSKNRTRIPCAFSAW